MRLIPIGAAAAIVLLAAPHCARSAIVAIDAGGPAAAASSFDLRMGGTSPSGESIGVGENRYLTRNGKPWLPVMGEFHFSRYPEKYWDEELSKMKAGGVQVVSTYLFWNHHEEVEGRFDWSGRRDIRRFVQLCKEHGLYVFLRVGPWSHGEARNGGFPDWLIAQGPTRRNDPKYLASVRRYFSQIGEQVKGLLWKDGGPVIGVQLENEYYVKGPGAGKEHLAELKTIARESGIEAPLYTVTGWGESEFPAAEMMPVFGGYPDNFWESSLNDMPPSGFYLFEKKRDNGEMGGGAASTEAAKAEYPYLMAEAGGGMQSAYHRRPVIQGDDVAAIALTRLGSGANLYGYYMFHGGANPDGKKTSLQESVESDHVYDLPKVSYDFQAPLGQFGEMQPAFRPAKLVHLFLSGFGSELALMRPAFPDVMPADAADVSVVRASARVSGDRGFLFVNNYRRAYPLPDRRGVQFQLKLASETALIPRRPVDVPAGDYFVWPVNLDMDGAVLKYATAQPLAKISDGDEDCYFFFAQPGIAPEFVLDGKSVRSLAARKATVVRRDGEMRVSGSRPGTDALLRVRTASGKKIVVVALTREQALDFWKLKIDGKERAVLSPSDVFSDAAGVLHLRSREVGRLRFAVWPALERAPSSSAALRPTGRDGVFDGYAAEVSPRRVDLRLEKKREAAPSTPVKLGRYNALAPTDADFERAGVWKISLPPDALDGLSDLFLSVDYAGDVARLYAGPRLLADDFYKGTKWDLGLKRFTADERAALELRIMPLRKDAPIYIPKDSLPSFPPSGEISDVRAIAAQPEYEVTVGPGAGK